MTRVAWITPGYPPDRGGVSDHSYAMVSALREQGHDVLVCAIPRQKQDFSDLDAKLKGYRPDAVIVAYVPNGVAPRTGGISPRFSLWCAQLRKRVGASTLLLAHEVCLPTLAHLRQRELKLALLGVAQTVQFEAIARAFDGTTFSHEASRQIWCKRIPRLHDRLRTVRICSSLPFVYSADPRAALVASGYSVPARTVLFFGTGHQSVSFELVEAAFLELLRVEPETRLVIIGLDAAKLRRLRPTLSDLGSRVLVLGFAPAKEVSLWFQVAELVLLPFRDGVSARKTTVAAAFQHGRAVVTTRGVNTCSDIPWASLCALSPLDSDRFAAVALEAFNDAQCRADFGEAARANYEAYAAPAVTAAQLLAHATCARAGS